MGNGDAPGFHGMLEMDVASLLGDLFPSVGPQSRKNVPTWCMTVRSIVRTNTHKIKGGNGRAGGLSEPTTTLARIIACNNF